MPIRLATLTRQLMVGVFVAIAVGIVAVGTAGPAGACSCAPTTDGEAIQRADAAFSGSLVEVVSRDGSVISSTDPERFVFDVDDVFKGDVTERQVVVTPRSGASCGLELAGPGPHLVFAFADSQLTSGAEAGELYSHLCSGTRPMSDGQVPVDFVPEPPAPTPSAVEDPDAGAESAVDVAGDGSDALWAPVAFAAGAFVLVSATIWWLRARHRS